VNLSGDHEPDNPFNPRMTPLETTKQSLTVARGVKHLFFDKQYGLAPPTFVSALSLRLTKLDALYADGYSLFSISGATKYFPSRAVSSSAPAGSATGGG
jgi:hypothetical protein